MRTRLGLGTAACALALAAAACGSSRSETRVSDQPAPVIKASAQSDLHGECVQFFDRQRECTDVFIPALVDLRIRIDIPAGIAATAQQEGRDALVAKAMEEWQSDSTDQAIDTTCTNIAQSLPPADADRLRQGAEECLAKATCDDFVACDMPLTEHHLRAAQH